MPYVVAVAACNREVFLEAYTPETRARQDIRELMTKIYAREDPGLPKWAARVTTTLKDGRKYSQEYLHVKGHPQNPFTEKELVEKFKKCVPFSVYKLSPETIESMIYSLLNLEKVEDVVEGIDSPFDAGLRRSEKIFSSGVLYSRAGDYLWYFWARVACTINRGLSTLTNLSGQ